MPAARIFSSSAEMTETNSSCFWGREDPEKQRAEATILDATR
ncbi:MAG: hypothetical protein Q8P67_14705 [archaeon]|nr:hypothetical protein [archaeon]